MVLLLQVAYGACGVLTDKGEAYGVMWTPNTPPAALQLPVTPAATAGCFLYMVSNNPQTFHDSRMHDARQLQLDGNIKGSNPDVYMFLFFLARVETCHDCPSLPGPPW